MTDGKHDIWIGLKGFATNSTVTWQETAITVDTTPPEIIVTNPAASSTVSVPFIQVQGLINEELSSLTYDVSNALEVLTNQTGYAGELFYDTNLMMFTTNSFQCYDVPLTNGLNTITLHATDLAGNVTTTNISMTLDYSGDTNPPVLNLVWPQDGTEIGGTNFTLQAQVDDNTATVTASINGQTNIGTVYRSGNVLVENLPLASGTNTLSLTATDAAGNSFTTNISVIQSAVTLTVDPISDDQLNQSSANVTGTVSGTNEDVWVNGIQATVSTNGTWSASNVPVSPTGTANLSARAYPAGSNPSTTPADGGQFSIQAQPAQVVLASYQYNSTDWQNTHLTDQDVPDGNGGVEHVAQDCWMPTTDNTSEFWVRGLGGAYQSSWQYLNAYHLCASGVVDNGPYSHSIDGGYPECYNYSASGSDDGDYADFVTSHESARATMALDTGGAGQVGTVALYLVQAQVYDEDTDEQLAAGAVRFVNQMAGTTTEDVTNDVGAVWSQALVSVPAGVTNVAVTPIAQGNIYFTGTQAKEMTIQSLTATNGATQIGTTTNWATVKTTTNDYVIVQATLNMTNTAAIAQAGTLIKWSGGEAVSGNPLQRKVSKATSAETTVTASLGSTNLSVNVWVVWANLTIKVSGTLDLDDKAEVLNNGNFPTQNTTYGSYGLGGGNSLGPIDCLNNPDLNYAYTIGKMEAKAVLQPTGIGNYVTNGAWNLKRTRIVIAWDNGGTPSESNPPPGTDDTSQDFAKYLNPANGDIFDLDGPGCSVDLPGTTVNHTAEVYDNFYEYATVNLGSGEQVCSTTNTWSYTAQVDVDNLTNKVQLNSVSTSLITLPTAPHYTQR